MMADQPGDIGIVFDNVNWRFHGDCPHLQGTWAKLNTC